MNLKKTFNPVKFNPEYWADLAKEADEIFRIHDEAS